MDLHCKRHEPRSFRNYQIRPTGMSCSFLHRAVGSDGAGDRQKVWLNQYLRRDHGADGIEASVAIGADV